MVFIDKFASYCGGSKALAWLLTANVAAGIALWLLSVVLHFCGIDSGFLYAWLALPSDPLSFATHPWTLLTYMFMHMSPLHLIFNMLWLYWFGRMLADIERPGTVLRLFIGGCVAGGICYLAASGLGGYPPGSFLTGSSAAVLTIMCVTGMRMPSRTLNLFLLGEVKLKWIAIGCIILTLLGGSGLPTQAAHLGGVAFGAAWFLKRRRISSPKPNLKTNKINTRTAAKAMRGSVPDDSRLDELLDKVRISGYESLSAKEKNELNYISQRIKL